MIIIINVVKSGHKTIHWNVLSRSQHVYIHLRDTVAISVECYKYLQAKKPILKTVPGLGCKPMYIDLASP